MVEQMTGLPISHFAMECDHAPGGGMACWDFSESALDFYDRNCVSCAVRQPVGLPNLGRLVAERDEARRAADARQGIELDRAERALQERRRSREELRPSLDAVNQALLDDLDAFDRDHADADRKRIAEAARMAPERIDPRVVDLLLTQAGAAMSLALVTLDVGAHVAKGERRLTSGDELYLRNGDDGLARERQGMHARYQPPCPACHVGLTVPVASMRPDRRHLVQPPLDGIFNCRRSPVQTVSLFVQYWPSLLRKIQRVPQLIEPYRDFGLPHPYDPRPDHCSS